MLLFPFLMLLAAPIRAGVPPAVPPRAGDAAVAFEQILADPDNVELNLRFARQEATAGNLRAALAALDRVLAVAPQRQDARLLRAALLFRLGSFQDADQELDVLSAAAPAPEIRERLAAFKRLVRRGGQHARLSVLVGAGFEYYSNRNAAPASGQSLLFDAPIPLQSGSQRRDDTAAVLLARVDAERDLADDPRRRLFGSLAYYRAEQTLLDALDLQDYALNGGIAFKSELLDVTPSLTFEHLLLAQSTYLRARGAALRVDRRFPGGLGLYVEGRDRYQDFSATSAIPTAARRNGVQIDGALGAEYALTPRLKAGLAYVHTIKRASFRAESFNRDGANLHHSWLIGRGMFLSSDLAVNWDSYEGHDPFISASRRRDNTWRARATFGTTLGFLASSLRDFAWTFTYEYFQDVSSLLNYSYTNNKAAAMLTYRWEAGL
ncbi:MAG: tetratricopeptide repeat protein [Elusimicrobia bacterium]|nr:tetratricopeptide repeat protein [Elusimicrobiota bacterium]